MIENNLDKNLLNSMNLIDQIKSLPLSSKDRVELEWKYWIELGINVISSIEIIIPILISIAYITLAERKIMGRMQRRIGPNRVGIIGLIQPIIDGIKLISKEIIIPQRVKILEMLIGPMIILTLCLIIWIPIP